MTALNTFENFYKLAEKSTSIDKNEQTSLNREAEECCRHLSVTIEAWFQKLILDRIKANRFN